jgi:hypothetical protein
MERDSGGTLHHAPCTGFGGANKQVLQRRESVSKGESGEEEWLYQSNYDEKLLFV